MVDVGYISWFKMPNITKNRHVNAVICVCGCVQVEKALEERKNEVETLRQQVCIGAGEWAGEETISAWASQKVNRFVCASKRCAS